MEAIRNAFANLYALFGGVVFMVIFVGIGASIGGFFGDLIAYIGVGFFLLVCLAVAVNMLRSFLSLFSYKGR